MIKRSELASYLDSKLDCNNIRDYSPNGLQIEGKEQITKLCTAVTASAEAIEKAIALKADALMVHHGYFWKGETPNITGIKRKRIAKLLKHDINLFAYHLPLDCHLEFGNNACLAQLWQVENIKQHKAGNVNNLLWSGNLPKPLNTDDFINLCQSKLKQSPIHISASTSKISKIAWCSGAAQDFIELAAEIGADAYISGEVSERTFYQAKELDIHYFSCGHHATERYGIQALGSHLEVKYGLTHHYIENNNPI